MSSIKSCKAEVCGEGVLCRACSRYEPAFMPWHCPHLLSEDVTAHRKNVGASVPRREPTYEMPVREAKGVACAQADNQSDAVSRPPHYTAGGIECIDAIRAAMTPEQFKGFLRGNAMKYLWRHEHKGGIEDLHKAGWYLNKLVEVG